MPRFARRSSTPSSMSAAGRVWLAVPAVLTAASLFAACASQDDAPASQGSPVPIVTQVPVGAEVYSRSCARCHGTAREGKVDAPALNEVRIGSMGDTVLRMVIRDGKGRMRGFGGLSEAQVNALINYLRTTS